MSDDQMEMGGQSTPEERAEAALESSKRLFARMILWAGLVAGVVGIVGGAIAWFAAGVSAAGTAIIAAFSAFAFAAITLLVVIWASSLRGTSFLAAVLGAELAKFLVFGIAIVMLLRLDWVHNSTFGIVLIAAFIGVIAVEALALHRSRMTFALPAAGTPDEDVRVRSGQDS